MEGIVTVVNSQERAEAFCQQVMDNFAKYGYTQYAEEHGASRSPLQNNSLHLFCEFLAHALNESGYDMKEVLSRLSKESDIPWTKTAVKERLWRPVQKAMTNEKSTTKPKRTEYPEIYEALMRALGQAGIEVDVEWPCKQRKAG